MGKNSKRRKGTWTPHPIDGCETGPAVAENDDGLLVEKKKKKTAAVGKKRKDESSLKKKKKNNNKPANSPALRQLLGDSFPRRKRSLHFDHLHNDDEEERFADLSDIVATDWRAEARMPPEGSDFDGESTSVEEEIYQSRKLVMRQLVMNQLSFIRQHFHPQEENDDQDGHAEDDGRLDRDGVSDVDSWQEMEERFAEIYEPIPYDVAMDSWRSMSKEQMLKTVTSRRLRSRMKYMSRAEILSQIQTLKSRHHDQRHKTKSPVYEDMSGTIHPPSAKISAASAEKQQQKKKKKVKMAKPEQQQQPTKSDTPIYQNTPSYQGLSLADIYQAKVEARRQELQQLKQQKASSRATQAGHNPEPNSLYVTKALVHAAPLASDDEGQQQQQKFLSRAGILSKLGAPATAPEPTKTKSDLIAQFWRQSDYITTEYSRSLGGGGQQPGKLPASTHSCSSSSPTSSSCPSDCDGCCDGGEECSMCSCSSCASDRTVRSSYQSPAVVVQPPSKPEVKANNNTIDQEKSKPGENSPEPVPLSLVKQRKMEFERLRILEEQENRLQELVRRTRSDASSPAHQSWLDLAQRARQLEDKWNMARRSTSSSSHAIYEPVPPSKLLKKEDKGRRNDRSKKRSKVIQQLKSRMKENLASESLDPRVRQRRHEELKELLSDAVHAGTQTLTNINLGLIYVPMERQHEKEPDKLGPPAGGLMSLKTDRAQLGSGNVAVANNDLSGDGGGGSTDDSEDLFGSIDTLIFEPKAGTGSSTIKTDELEEVEERIAQQFDYLNDYGSCQEEDSSDDCTKAPTGNGSKNGRRAAVAAVAAASPPPNTTAGHPGATGSCAAAASCDASASKSSGPSESDGESLASFTSVIFQGQKLLDEEEERTKIVTTSEKKSSGSTLDSEHYTNVDTDASWDYYPDGDGLEEADDRMKSVANKTNPLLAVGNLRKRPPQLLPEDEADETARLLESLRIAEDCNVSTSLRLLFPPSSLKLSAAGRNIFTDMANDALNSPSLPAFADNEPSSMRYDAQPPDSGFRSLPELIQAKPPTAGQTTGLRKRDTMIRELKMRLRDKFHCVGDDGNHSTPPFGLSPGPSRPPETEPSARLQEAKKKPKKVASKLESILASFNALAQMRSEGRVYRTVPQPLSLPAEYYTNDVDYESPESVHNDPMRAFHSTGYPHHLLQLREDDAIPVYDPSLPDDVAIHYAEIPRPMEPIEILHRQQQLAREMEQHYPLGLDPRLRAWYDNSLFEQRMESYPHEGLYNISEPLEEENPQTAERKKKSRRKSRRRTKEDAESTEDEVDAINPELTWSDIEEHLFPDQIADDFAGEAGFHPAIPAQSRMAPYRDEWLFWDQLNNMRWTEADRQRWDEERARRMLLWIHHSQGPDGAAPGSRPPQWWQVFDS